MVGTGGEVELLHGGFEQFFAGGVGLAEVAHFGWPHFGVAGGGCAFETVELAGQDGYHSPCALGDVSPAARIISREEHS